MTNDELDRALRQLRLGGMADTLTVRAQQARAETLGPIDFLGLLVLGAAGDNCARSR